jgi:hypothetical protein
VAEQDKLILKVIKREKRVQCCTSREWGESEACGTPCSVARHAGWQCSISQHVTHLWHDLGGVKIYIAHCKVASTCLLGE